MVLRSRRPFSLVCFCLGWLLVSIMGCDLVNLGHDWRSSYVLPVQGQSWVNVWSHLGTNLRKLFWEKSWVWFGFGLGLDSCRLHQKILSMYRQRILSRWFPSAAATICQQPLTTARTGRGFRFPFAEITAYLFGAARFARARMFANSGFIPCRTLPIRRVTILHYVIRQLSPLLLYIIHYSRHSCTCIDDNLASPEAATVS